jgi:hypothetical protein
MRVDNAQGALQISQSSATDKAKPFNATSAGLSGVFGTSTFQAAPTMEGAAKPGMPGAPAPTAANPLVAPSAQLLFAAAQLQNNGRVGKKALAAMHDQLDKAFGHDDAHKALLGMLAKGSPQAKKLSDSGTQWIREHAALGVLKAAAKAGKIDAMVRQAALDEVAKHFGKSAVKSVKGNLDKLVKTALGK